MADIDDLGGIVGIGIVAYLAYKEWYDGMSIEQILEDVDAKIRGLLDDIISKIPALPAPPQFQFLPPNPGPSTPYNPNPQPQDQIQPTNDENQPITPEDAGQLPDEVSKTETEKVKQPTTTTTTNQQQFPPTPSNVRGTILAFAGDFDSNAKAIQTRESIAKHGCQLIIGTGDYSYSDESASTWFNKIIGPTWNGKMRGCLGNHDVHDISGFLRIFGMTNFNSAVKVAPNLTVVFINTESGINEQTLESLTKSAKSQSKHVAYVFHKPYMTSSDGHHKGSENKWSSTIDTVAKRHGVRLMVAGHNHNYEHSHYQGIHYITSGAAGRKFYQTGCKINGAIKCVNDTNGWLKVTAGDDLFCEFVSNSGEVLDSFTVSATAGGDKIAAQQFLRAYISPQIYITRNRR